MKEIDINHSNLNAPPVLGFRMPPALRERMIHEGWYAPKKKKKKKNKGLWKYSPTHNNTKTQSFPGGMIPSIPVQPLPISIDNFFIKTKGVFVEIRVKPDSFTSFFKSKGSEYFTNEAQTHLIRISDHWGYNIRFCDWILRTVDGKNQKVSSFKWKKLFGPKKRIGIITYENLSENRKHGNNAQIGEEKISSRHPY